MSSTGCRGSAVRALSGVPTRRLSTIAARSGTAPAAGGGCARCVVGGHAVGSSPGACEASPCGLWRQYRRPPGPVACGVCPSARGAWRRAAGRAPVAPCQPHDLPRCCGARTIAGPRRCMGMTRHDTATRFLAALAGDASGGELLELRYRLPDGQRMGQVFERPARVRGLATRAIALGGAPTCMSGARPGRAATAAATRSSARLCCGPTATATTRSPRSRRLLPHRGS